MARFSLVSAWASAGALLAALAAAQTPAGTAFTYQGRLDDGGSPANGAYDFEFRLFDAATGGNPVGGVVSTLGVASTAACSR